MTTITREERERVFELLDLLDEEQADLLRSRERGQPVECALLLADIDRVAQALRDAEVKAQRGDLNAAFAAGVAQGYADAERDAAPQWREVTETEPAQGEHVLLGNPTGCGIGARDDSGDQRAWVINGLRLVDDARTWQWMPPPAPPAPPAVVAAPVIVSDQDRIATLERAVAELTSRWARWVRDEPAR